MAVRHTTLSIPTKGQGTYEITAAVAAAVKHSGIESGLATIFCQHTSCSLVIMENADSSARRDLESWLNRLVPENDPNFEHTLEGADDMPSHVKMALTRTSETVPVIGSALQLGTWQGLFLWEHRHARHMRSLLVTVIGE